MTQYKVLTKCATGSPEDCWAIDGEPIRYDSIADAHYDIIEAVIDLGGSYDDYIIEVA